MASSSVQNSKVRELQADLERLLIESVKIGNDISFAHIRIGWCRNKPDHPSAKAKIRELRHSIRALENRENVLELEISRKKFEIGAELDKLEKAKKEAEKNGKNWRLWP